MSLPIAYDVIRSGEAGSPYSALKEVAANAPIPSAPWERITAEQFATETATSRRQETDVIIQRLTNAEYAALHSAQAANYAIHKLMYRAACTGMIDEADPDFPAAVAALDGLGIIAANRWDQLFAP